MTKKDLIQTAKILNAENLDEIKSAAALYEMEKPFKTIAMSYGVYGMNAGLFQSLKTGNYYYTANRGTNLFIFA